MSAHESMEHAEHAEHASDSNKKIALLIAVIALCLALSETLGKGAQTESISKNVEASNLWAFFQAKSIRRTNVQTAAETGKLILGVASDETNKAAVQKQIEDWQKTAGATAQSRRPAKVPSNWPRAPSMPSTNVTTRRQNTITSKSRPPHSRSASCWRPRLSSPALLRWPGCRAS